MKPLLLVLSLLSSHAIAATVKDNPCKIPQSSTGIAMMQEMYEAMRIDTSTLDEGKTKTELIANNVVDDVLATQFAVEDYKKSPDNWLSVQKYKELYSDNNPRNLIIKFTYENKEQKKNIFLVSALADDYECNLRFNGYIIVKREF